MRREEGLKAEGESKQSVDGKAGGRGRRETMHQASMVAAEASYR